MFGGPLYTDAKLLLQPGKSLGRGGKIDTLGSLLDLAAPLRSQIFLDVVGDLLCYSGIDEVNLEVDSIRGVCRELRDQIDEECLTFNYSDSSCPTGDVRLDQREVDRINRAIRRHRRVKFFECLLHSESRFRELLERLELSPAAYCSFTFEFEVTAKQMHCLLRRFRVRRLNIITQDTDDSRPGDSSGWSWLPETQGLRTLCLRSSSEATVQSFLAQCPRLQGLQLNDCRLHSDQGIRPERLTSLSLAWVSTMCDDCFSSIIGRCLRLTSLHICRCSISFITVALPRLELLSVTHCRQLSDECVTGMLQPSRNPSLRFVDLTENKGLVSPWIAHTELEIAWLTHCSHLSDQAVTHLFQNCPSLSTVSLVQSSIETAMICSPALRTLELATSQKLSDAAVTHLLRHCPSLNFLDVGHCCQLLEPQFVHATLETILMSFCVNLRESAVATMFASCPSLRYVEMAVCMFDMTRFQREYGEKCQVVVNFDF